MQNAKSVVVHQDADILVLQPKHALLHSFAVLVQQVTVFFVARLLRKTVQQNLRSLVALETLQVMEKRVKRLALERRVQSDTRTSARTPTISSMAPDWHILIAYS